MDKYTTALSDPDHNLYADVINIIVDYCENMKILIKTSNLLFYDFHDFLEGYYNYPYHDENGKILYFKIDKGRYYIQIRNRVLRGHGRDDFCYYMKWAHWIYLL